MSLFHMPAEYARDYPPPRGNALLLSCMDLRLLDDIEEFMDHDNLANRYDHLVFAGASLGALGAPGAATEYPHWRQCFFDHLGAAVELHAVKDVYVMEHRHCGAYHGVFKVCPEFGDTAKEQADEEAVHLKYATLLEAEIGKWAAAKGVELRVRKFLMDLRGSVFQMTSARTGRGKRTS